MINSYSTVSAGVLLSSNDLELQSEISANTPITIPLDCGYSSDVVYHPNKPYIYISEENTDRVFIINTLDSTVNIITDILRPTNIDIYQNKLFIGSSYNKKITILNDDSLECENFILTESFFNDMIVGNDGYVYILTTNGYCESYAIGATKINSTFSVPEHNSLVRHPTRNEFYGATKSQFPPNISKISYQSGKASREFQNSFNRELTHGSKCYISPDGKYLFNSSGNVFTTAPDDDLNYYFSLDRGFDAICFDIQNNIFYISNMYKLYSYNYETFEPIGSYDLHKECDDMFIQNNKLCLVLDDWYTDYASRKIVMILRPSDFTDNPTNEIITIPLSVTENKIDLNCLAVTDTVEDQQNQNIIYGVDNKKKEIFKLDFNTLSKMSLQTAFIPNNILFYNGDLYVGYGENGIVEIRDANTFVKKDTLFIRSPFTDFVFGNDGYMYIAALCKVLSFSLLERQKINEYSAGNNSKLALHTTRNSIYLTTVYNNYYYQDYILKYSSGSFTLLNSLYNDNYTKGSLNKVSPNGQSIFNSAGHILISSDDRSYDMAYKKGLLSSFDDVCFDTNKNRIYTCSITDDYIKAYSYDTEFLTGTIPCIKGVFKLYTKENALLAFYQNGEQIMAQMISSDGEKPITFNKLTVECTGNKLQPTETVTLNPKIYSSDDTFTFDVNRIATYTSDDKNIIEVTSKGLVKALNYGKATITVTYMDISETIDFFVVPKLISITASNGDLNPIFSSNIQKYTLCLPRGTLTVPQISCVAKDPNAIVEITTADTLAGTTIIKLYDATKTVENIYEIKYEVSIYDESAHPYSNNYNNTWVYTSKQALGGIAISFSDRTEVEQGYDYINILDNKGHHIIGSPFTGKELADKTVTIPGNIAILQLISDRYTTAYGFKITDIKEFNYSIDNRFISDIISVTNGQGDNLMNAPESGEIVVNTQLCNITDQAVDKITMFIALFDQNDKLIQIDTLEKDCLSNQIVPFTKTIKIKSGTAYVKILVLDHTLKPIIQKKVLYQNE